MPTAPLRAFFIFAGKATPCNPVGLDGLKLTRTPDESGYFLRDKLSKSLVFREDDFTFLWQLENSSDRCAPLALRLEYYDNTLKQYRFVYKGSFTLSECTWTPAECRVEVPLVTDDPYRALFENWEREYNLLNTPSPRITTSVQFETISNGIQFEFARTDRDHESDYVGIESWAVFLRNTSWITGTTTQRGVRDETVIVFRLVQRGVPYEKQANNTFGPRDLSANGFYLIKADPDTQLADYAKTPEITGFKPFVIGSYGDWSPGNNHIYGDKLLLLPCGQTPANQDDYIEVTGSGGASTAECNGCVNVRQKIGYDNCRSIWWKFGAFEFKQGIPLLDALHYLLSLTAPTLCPPRPGQLSQFFSNPTNYVLSTTGALNELPELMLAAASDIKRSTASEAATRLLVSFKTILTDLCAGYNCGYFVDPATGWLRIEHRKWRDAQALSPIDLTSPTHAARTKGLTQYTYLTKQTPARQVLQASNAVTDSYTESQVSFTDATIRYEGQCVNTREGENTATVSLSRLTTDLPGLLLSGDAISDQAIVLLAPRPDGVIPNANARASLSTLIRNYHRHGGIRSYAFFEEVEADLESIRPTRQQQPLTVCLPLEAIAPQSRFTTELSSEGEVGSADFEFAEGLITLTLLHPAPNEAGLTPSGLGRQFDDSFDQSFG